jgi:iron-sulfur cluster repair protein YtfE (RIC family)
MAQDIINMLREDHDRVRKLLTELTETTERAAKRRPELLQKIEREVLQHMRLEEQLFYPALKDSNGRQSLHLYYEALEEHRAVNALVLPDLKGMEPTSGAFTGRAKVLRDIIEHHMVEDENRLFPLAQDTMDPALFEQLAAQAVEFKTAARAGDPAG